MKKIICLFAAAALLSSFAPRALSWGKIGHSTVAQVAENHLTPKARKALQKYVGIPLAALASDADTYRNVWTFDLGFVPTNLSDARPSFLKNFDRSLPPNIAPWSHSITVDENFKCYPTDNLDGAYINNVAYYADKLARQLHDSVDQMTPEERYRAVALIVHFLGDMHCPVHIVYLPKNPLKGKISVTFKGKPTSLHTFWDGEIFSAAFPWSFGDMASLVDTASPKEIKEITAGDVYDWAGKSAADCWEANNIFHEGDKIPNSYPYDARPLLFSQLRNGGYRLAAILNWAFR